MRSSGCCKTTLNSSLGCPARERSADTKFSNARASPNAGPPVLAFDGCACGKLCHFSPIHSEFGAPLRRRAGTRPLPPWCLKLLCHFARSAQSFERHALRPKIYTAAEVKRQANALSHVPRHGRCVNVENLLRSLPPRRHLVDVDAAPVTGGRASRCAAVAKEISRSLRPSFRSARRSSSESQIWVR